jgi:hypothetical protein
MHYNSEDADLFTYLADPSVFAVKDGYITTPGGESYILGYSYTSLFVIYQW